jgi:homoserine kinase type II
MPFMGIFTVLSKNEIEMVVNAYDIGNLVAFSPIDKGTDKTLYRVETDKASCLLSIFENKTEGFVEDEVCIIKALKDKGFPTPSIFYPKTGNEYISVKGRPALLLEFSDGSEKSIAGQAEIKEIGNLLASFHDICKGLSIQRKARYSYDNLRQYYGRIGVESIKNTELVKLLSVNIEHVFTNKPKDISEGITHNDLFQDNVLWKAGKVAAVLDFGDVHRFYYPFDLAVTIDQWAFKDNILDLKNLDTLVKSYVENHPLSTQDITSIPYFMRFDCLHRIMWRYLRFEVDKELGTRKKDYREYVQKLEDINSKEKDMKEILLSL